MLSKNALKIEIGSDGEPMLSLAEVNISSTATIAKALCAEVDSLRWLRVGPMLLIGIAVGQVATFACCSQHVITLRGPTLMFDIKEAPENAGSGGPIMQFINSMGEAELKLFTENKITYKGDHGGQELRPMESPLHNLDPGDGRQGGGDFDQFIDALSSALGGSVSVEAYTIGPKGLQRLGGRSTLQPIELRLSFEIEPGKTFPNLLDVFITAAHSWLQASQDPRNRLPEELGLKQISFGDALIEHVGEFLEKNPDAFDETTIGKRRAAAILEERARMNAAMREQKDS